LAGAPTITGRAALTAHLPRLVVAALAALGLATAALATAGTAGADPTPPPSLGYQIPGPAGPQFPGAQVCPRMCRWQPRSCGLEYDPGSGT
jgi:hypothetical protein